MRRKIRPARPTLRRILAALTGMLFAAVLIIGHADQAGAQSGGASLSVGSGSGLPGASGIQIPVSLSSNTDVAGVNFDLNFDPAKVTVTDVQAGSAANAADKDVSYTLNTGFVRVLVAGLNTNPIPNGTLVVVTFSIHSNASPGDTPLSLSNVAATNPSGGSVSVSTSNGKITILQPQATPTPSHTPSRTSSPTATPTRTPSRTPTPTFTPSRTATAGPSSTPSMTFTPSATRPTATPSVTKTFDPNASPTPSTQGSGASPAAGATSGPGGFSNMLPGDMETAVVATATALAEAEQASRTNTGLRPASSGLWTQIVAFAQSWLGIPTLLLLAAIEFGLLALMVRTLFP